MADTDLVRPRTFRLVRDEDVTGVSGTGTVADGVRWPDGSMSVRWRGRYPSIVFWAAGAEAVEYVNGHDGRTHLEWDLERVVPPDLAEVRKILTSAQQGEIEGWSQETQLELLWGLARHVDGLLAAVATARDSVPVRSEADVLRAAADRFRRAAAMHQPLLDDPDSKKWWDAYTEAADCLKTWATNGGVPPLGERAAAAAEATPEVDRG